MAFNTWGILPAYSLFHSVTKERGKGGCGVYSGILEKKVERSTVGSRGTRKWGAGSVISSAALTYKPMASSTGEKL